MINPRAVVEAVQSGQAAGDSFAATWRDDDGAIVGHSFGGTVCWFPKLPGRLRIAGEGFEHIARCRECPGCLELDRRRLADRLVEKYSAAHGDEVHSTRVKGQCRKADRQSSRVALFLVRCYVPLENQGRFAHRVHRIRRLGLEPGFWRLGTSSVALLSRFRAPLVDWLRNKRIAFRIEPLKLRRGRRAWNSLTRGLLIAREKYGENLNRWYAKGLPQIDRQKWQVVKREYEKGYDRQSSPRAWKAGRVVLVPPEAWRLGRLDRRRLRAALRGVADPDQMPAVAELAGKLASARSLDSLLTASPQLLPSREQIEEFYVNQRARRGRRRGAASFDSSSSPTSEVGGYASSEHGIHTQPTAEELAERSREAIERIKHRQDDSLLSSFDRLIAKAEAREGKVLPKARAAAEKLRKKLTGGK